MDIVIIADFCCQFEKELNSRFLYLANLLSEDHTVEVITSDFNHEKKDYFKFLPKGFAFTITMLHEGKYKKNVCLSRFKAHFIWGKNVRQYLEKRKKPDIVYCAVPTLQASYEAAKYCQKNDIRFIVDIQDLWPEAFQMVFNIPIVSNVLFYPLKKIADKSYKNADAICAVSESYVKRALEVNKKISSGKAVFLGTELNKFDSNVKKNKIKKTKDELWLAYCGSLGDSYDIKGVIDALNIVRSRGESVPRFIVMGSGEKELEFKNYAESKGIEAVFTGNLPYEKMCGLLCECDITVNPIVKGSAASIINKHGDYAASGLPVLNTQESEEYRKLVEQYQMGFNCENGNAKDLAEKMIKLIKDSDLRRIMGNNARKCAEEKFDRKNSYREIEKLICQH